MRRVSQEGAALGPVVYRVPFAAEYARRFVLFVFGGLTLMVSVWTWTMLHSTVFTFEGESHGLFRGILVFFTLFIVLGFSAAWSVLGRYPRALVVRERGLVLEHGSRTRSLGFGEVNGIDQRDQDGTLVYVVLVAGGGEIPFGNERPSVEAARAIVRQAGLVWSEEPLRAVRDD